MLAKLPLLGCLMRVQLRAAGRDLARRDSANDEYVVLLHGLGRTSVSMKRIEWSLRTAGYRVINVSYPSRRFSIGELAEDWLHPLICKRVPVATKIHFVTHSLGGIIVRHYLAAHTVENLGRVVMFAPPNQGSEIVDEVKRVAWGRRILGPSGSQLGTGKDELPRALGPVNFELGVLAGDRSVNPVLSRFLPGLNDGKVSLGSARVAGMIDFAVLHSSHTWMQWRRAAVQQVLAFLQHGAFHHSS